MRYNPDIQIENPRLVRREQVSRNVMARYFCCTSICRPAASGAIKPFWWTITRNAVLILVYYMLSIGLTFYQNRLVRKIHYPLTVVMCHFVVKFLVASLMRLGYEIWTKKHRVLLECDVWIKRLCLVGLSGGFDIGLSNWSLELITVSLYTMTKSTAIIFILGFALALKLEEKHWSLVVIVGMISMGLFMFTYKSTQFQMEGFLLVLAASFISGMRWSMTQLVVQKSTLGLQNPVDMVYHVQPWMIVAALPLAALVEGPHISQQSIPFDTPAQQAAVFRVVFSVLIGALMALSMELAEYLVITYTSSLTFAVAGIFKEICTLCLAVILNGDEMTFINFIGLLLCLVGIICHVGFKFYKSTNELKNPSVSPSNLNHAPPGQVLVKRTHVQEVVNQDTSFSNSFSNEFKSKEDNVPLLRNYNKLDDIQITPDTSDESDADENIIWRA